MKKLYYIVILIVLISSCNGKTGSIREFNRHKKDILKFHETWRTNKLILENEMIINTFHSASIGVHFDYAPTETIAFWFDKSGLQYYEFSITEDSLLTSDPEKFNLLEALIKSDEFQKDIEILVKTGVRWAKFKKDYFFISYGAGSSHPDYTGGIHIRNNRLDKDYRIPEGNKKNLIDKGIYYSSERL